MQIVKLMGLLDPVQDHKMGTVHVDVNRLMATASDQYVEIMRDHLSKYSIMPHAMT